MLDIGWSEMLVIAAVAIVVIGPKDLPTALRSIGRWIAKARAAAREFQSGIDQMVADAELDELRKTAQSVRDMDADTLLDKVDPTGSPAPQASSPPPSTQDSPAPAPTAADNVAGHIDTAEAGATAEVADIVPPAQVAPPHSLMHAGQAVDYMPPTEEAGDDEKAPGTGTAGEDTPPSSPPRRAGGADG